VFTKKNQKCDERKKTNENIASGGVRRPSPTKRAVIEEVRAIIVPLKRFHIRRRGGAKNLGKMHPVYVKALITSEPLERIHQILTVKRP